MSKFVFGENIFKIYCLLTVSKKCYKNIHQIYRMSK